MNKPATLKDIARETGVHVSTVSRALDPNRVTPISDDVISRVRSTAERLGYRPNRIAYGLRTQRSMTIGVMIPDITNTIFPPIVRGIESVLEQHGYVAIIVNTDSQQTREQRLLETLQERGVDGIIHTAVQLEDPAISMLAERGLPVITLNRRIDHAGIPCIVNDDCAGIDAVFTHLFEQGHRRIAHIAGPETLSTGQLRLDAFRESAIRKGLSIDTLTIEIAGQFDEKDGRSAAAKILRRDPSTTALLCANDRLALGAIDHCRFAGLNCPSDISVTGFNDMPLLELIPPRLTTVRIQQFEAGAVAARQLLQMITSPDSNISRQTVLAIELIKRDSVAVPRSI